MVVLDKYLTFEAQPWQNTLLNQSSLYLNVTTRAPLPGLGGIVPTLFDDLGQVVHVQVQYSDDSTSPKTPEARAGPADCSLSWAQSSSSHTFSRMVSIDMPRAVDSERLISLLNQTALGSGLITSSGSGLRCPETRFVSRRHVGLHYLGINSPARHRMRAEG